MNKSKLKLLDGFLHIVKYGLHMQKSFPKLREV